MRSLTFYLTLGVCALGMGLPGMAVSMTGASAAEGPFQLADGAAIPYAVSIPAGKGQGTFTIITSKGTWWGTKQFTVGAKLGSEQVSASFTAMTRQ